MLEFTRKKIKVVRKKKNFCHLPQPHSQKKYIYIFFLHRLPLLLKCLVYAPAMLPLPLENMMRYMWELEPKADIFVRHKTVYSITAHKIHTFFFVCLTKIYLTSPIYLSVYQNSRRISNYLHSIVFVSFNIIMLMILNSQEIHVSMSEIEEKYF